MQWETEHLTWFFTMLTQEPQHEDQVTDTPCGMGELVVDYRTLFKHTGVVD